MYLLIIPYSKKLLAVKKFGRLVSKIGLAEKTLAD